MGWRDLAVVALIYRHHLTVEEEVVVVPNHLLIVTNLRNLRISATSYSMISVRRLMRLSNSLMICNRTSNKRSANSSSSQLMAMISLDKHQANHIKRRNFSWRDSLKKKSNVVNCPSKMIELHATVKVSQTCYRWLQWVLKPILGRDLSSPLTKILSWALSAMKMAILLLMRQDSCKTRKLTTVTIDLRFVQWLTHSLTKRLFENIANMQTRPWRKRWKICAEMVITRW